MHHSVATKFGNVEQTGMLKSVAFDKISPVGGVIRFKELELHLSAAASSNHTHVLQRKHILFFTIRKK